MNEFVVGARLHDIPIRAVGVTVRQVGLVVRRGEDDNRNCTEAGIGPESNQKVATIPSAELEIEEDQKGGDGLAREVERSPEAYWKEMLGL